MKLQKTLNTTPEVKILLFFFVLFLLILQLILLQGETGHVSLSSVKCPKSSFQLANKCCFFLWQTFLPILSLLRLEYNLCMHHLDILTKQAPQNQKWQRKALTYSTSVFKETSMYWLLKHLNILITDKSLRQTIPTKVHFFAVLCVKQSSLL